MGWRSINTSLAGNRMLQNLRRHCCLRLSWLSADYARHRNSYREGGKSASERMFFGYRVSAEEAERGLEVFWAMQNKLGPARRYPSSKESHHGSAVVSRPPGSDWVTAR